MSVLDQEVTFDAHELGELTIELQAYCYGCRRVETCNPLRSPCPVGLTRDILGKYLHDGQQINTDHAADALAGQVALIHQGTTDLRPALQAIPRLCNRCLFHTAQCFLNLAYLTLELAVHGQQVKPANTRPGSLLP